MTAIAGLRLKLLPQPFTVSRFAPEAELPTQLWQRSWVFVARTDEELSLVCPTALLDEEALEPAQREDDWRAFKVQGPLAFELVGILAGISASLADASISLFAVSTYDTDYVLVQNADLAASVTALEAAGGEVLPEAPDG